MQHATYDNDLRMHKTSTKANKKEKRVQTEGNKFFLLLNECSPKLSRKLK